MAGPAMKMPREGQHMISPRQKHERQRGICSRGYKADKNEPRGGECDLK
jgi:hypothetical protein